MVWTIEVADVSYCPLCGGSLSVRVTHDGDRPYCDTCNLTLYQNPIPIARATVVDGDSLLLIEIGDGRDEGEWALPGGHGKPNEPPSVTAARELEEETGLSVEPDALTLMGDGFLAFDNGESMVSFNYAVPMEEAEGVIKNSRRRDGRSVLDARGDSNANVAAPCIWTFTTSSDDR